MMCQPFCVDERHPLYSLPFKSAGGILLFTFWYLCSEDTVHVSKKHEQVTQTHPTSRSPPHQHHRHHHDRHHDHCHRLHRPIMQGCVAGTAAAGAAATPPVGIQPAAAAAEEPPRGESCEQPGLSGVDSESDDLDFEYSAAVPAALKEYTVRKKHLVCKKCLAVDPGVPVFFTCSSALRLHDTRKHGAHSYQCKVPACGRCFATRQDRSRHFIADHQDRDSTVYHRHRQHMRNGDKTRHSSMVTYNPAEYYQRQERRRVAYAVKRRAAYPQRYNDEYV